MAELPAHFEMPLVQVWVHGDPRWQGVCWCGRRTKVVHAPGMAQRRIQEHVVAKNGVVR